MNTDIGQIMKALKSLIKTKGYTYKAIASELNMSEAGIKRLMNAKDISLNRVLEICKVLDVSINDLVSISEHIEKEVEHFTEDQISFFEQNLNHLKYYYKLRVEFLTPKQIKEQWKLSDKENQTYLLELDKVNLIKLLPGDKVEKFSKREVYWKDINHIFQKFKNEFTIDLIDYFGSKNRDKMGFYPIYHLNLSKLSIESLCLDFEELIKTYVKKSTHEALAMKPSNLLPVNIACLIGQTYGFQKREN